MTQESTIESYLVKRIVALGGFALKGAVPGRRFIDRICILPDGVTLWIECKRPCGGRRTTLQEDTIGRLLDLGHFAFFVKTKEEVDMVLDWPRVFYRERPDGGGLFVGNVTHPGGLWHSTSKGLVKV